MNEFATFRHGLILWENGATPLEIILNTSQTSKYDFHYKKVRASPWRADYSSCVDSLVESNIGFPTVLFISHLSSE